LAYVLSAPLRGSDPVMVRIGRVVPNEFLMPALQVGNPVAVHVHVKPDNLFRDGRRLRTHGLHNSIIRPVRHSEYVDYW